MGATFKSRIAKADSGFELSCIWEEVRDRYWTKHTMSQRLYKQRAKEIVDRRKELAERR